MISSDYELLSLSFLGAILVYSVVRVGWGNLIIPWLGAVLKISYGGECWLGWELAKWFCIVVHRWIMSQFIGQVVILFSNSPPLLKWIKLARFGFSISISTNRGDLLCGCSFYVSRSCIYFLWWRVSWKLAFFFNRFTRSCVLPIIARMLQARTQRVGTVRLVSVVWPPCTLFRFCFRRCASYGEAWWPPLWWSLQVSFCYLVSALLDYAR